MKNGSDDAASPARRPDSVSTHTRFRASAESVWNGLMFYENIPRRPTLLLRLLLPVPLRAEGLLSAPGDSTRCIYEEGHLLKRATRIDRCRLYRFRVTEQNLAIGRGVRLLGGEYALRELPDGTTRVELVTRYRSRTRPRWLWRAIERTVCHSFHRYILASMRSGLETAPRERAARLRRVAPSRFDSHSE